MRFDLCRKKRAKKEESEPSSEESEQEVKKPKRTTKKIQKVEVEESSDEAPPPKREPEVKIPDPLKCSLCNELFIEPQMYVCGHSVCKVIYFFIRISLLSRFVADLVLVPCVLQWIIIYLQSQISLSINTSNLHFLFNTKRDKPNFKKFNTSKNVSLSISEANVINYYLIYLMNSFAIVSSLHGR